jgi:hypothetical protein
MRGRRSPRSSGDRRAGRRPRGNLMSGGTSCDSETAGLCFVNDDTVTYAGRLNRVRADADIAAADDGEAGEGDTIIADVERIVGGNGNNVLGGITTNFFHFSGLRRLVGMRFEGRAGNDVCEARELRIRSWEERATTSSTAVAGPTRFRRATERPHSWRCGSGPAGRRQGSGSAFCPRQPARSSERRRRKRRGPGRCRA